MVQVQGENMRFYYFSYTKKCGNIVVYYLRRVPYKFTIAVFATTMFNTATFFSHAVPLFNISFCKTSFFSYGRLSLKNNNNKKSLLSVFSPIKFYFLLEEWFLKAYL